ncbi:hypothetical protein GGR54DRAFT_641433 [Hypoxylon sp. NC1633]|nr:hypothetical protein GGR54DRAFT_641433 [Hypoxylon sp. NC1633]
MENPPNLPFIPRQALYKMCPPKDQYPEYLRDILEKRKYYQRFAVYSFLQLLVQPLMAQQSFDSDEVISLPATKYLASVSVVGEHQNALPNATRPYFNPPQNVETPQITLIRGFPNPRVLQALGAWYSLNIDTLLCHCSFPEEEPPVHLYPMLPSGDTQSITIRIVSLAKSERSLLSCFQTLFACQCHMTKSLIEYNRDLYTTVSSGKEVVRSINVHDMYHISVEQQVTYIAGQRSDRTWYGILLTDQGRPAHEPPWNLSSDKSTTFQFCSLGDHRYLRRPRGVSEKDWGPRSPDPFRSRAESSSRLGVDLQLAYASGPFSFTIDVIRTSVLGWCQLLDFLSNLDADDMLPPDQAAERIRANKAVVDRASSYLTELLHYIRRRGLSHWPNFPSHPSLERILEDLSEDIVALSTYARDLSKRYSNMLQILMNRVSILESQRNLRQAEITGQLTALAFVFVPLTFFTSVFGMNVVEISGSPDNPSLKIVLGVALPITLAIVVVPIWSLFRLRHE